MRHIGLLFAIGLAFAGGWWLRGMVSLAPSLPAIAPIFSERSEGAASPKVEGGTITVLPDASGAENTGNASEPVAAFSPKNVRELPGESLRQLLERGAFSEALNLIATTEQRDELRWREMRKTLGEYLNSLLRDNRYARLQEIVNATLDVYYNDISVLEIRLKAQQAQGHYTEAIATLHLIEEYAFLPDQRRQFQQALGSFLTSAEVDFAREGEWWRLVEIYRQAAEVSLLDSVQLLRFAELAHFTGDVILARSVLQDLKRDRRISEDIAVVLQRFAQAGTPEVNNFARFESQVQLRQVGNQFVVELGVERSPVPLLIDTGASLTTITSELAEGLISGGGFTRVGVQRFSTANGRTFGTVYNVDRIVLGPYELTDLKVAVLNFPMDKGIGGLLGMNVLGKFNFEIDQEAALLHLSPR